MYESLVEQSPTAFSLPIMPMRTRDQPVPDVACWLMPSIRQYGWSELPEIRPSHDDSPAAELIGVLGETSPRRFAPAMPRLT